MQNPGMQKRYFTRLFGFNVVIVMLITVVPLMIYYRYFSSAYNTELKNFNQQTVMQISQTIDQRFLKDSIVTVNRSVTDNLQKSILLYPTTHAIRKDSSAILDVVTQIESIRKNMAFVKSIDIYYMNENVLFYDSKFCFLDDDGCEVGSRRDWIARVQSSDLQVDWLGPRPLMGPGTDAVVTYIRSIPYFSTLANRKAVIAVNIDARAITSTLASLQPPEKGTLLILDNEGRVVATNRQADGAAAVMADSDPWLGKVMQSDTDLMFNAKISGNKMMVSSAKSAFNQWHYVSLANKDVFYKKADDLRNLLFSLCILFLLGSILVSVYINRRAYLPIRGILSDMFVKAENHKPIIRHNLIMGLLHDDIPLSEDDMRDIMALKPACSRFFCFIIQTSEGGNFGSEQSRAYRLIDSLHLNENDAFQIWAARNYGHKVLGIAFCQDHCQSRAEAFIQDKIELLYGRNYVLACGNDYAREDRRIAASYSEAEEALKYTFVRPQDRTLSYSGLRLESRLESGSPVAILDEIENCIRACDGKKAVQIIEEIVEDIAEGHYTRAYCEHLLADVVTTIRRVVKSMGFSSSQLFGCDIREQFKQTAHIHAFSEWISDIVRTAVSNIEERKQSIDQKLELNVKTYIEQHLYDDISLELVADHMNVSPNYLGKLFKLSTGVKFTEYLTERRLTEAVKLLKERKHTVQEISSRIGYSSTTHFIRIFKEKYGDTPKRYQKWL